VKKFNREANARVLAKTKKILKESKRERNNPMVNKRIRVFSAILKQLQTKPSQQETEFETEMTIQKYCNPGCKGTVYQDTEHSKADLEKMFGSYGKRKKRIIANFKKAVLMVAGASVQKLMMTLAKEQEILMNIADMMIE
jgi:hypothetical protein